MSVYLERYSVPKAPKLGIDLHDLVRNERDWLQEAFPGTVERYRSLPRAIRNVFRIATDKGIEAYVIRNGRHLGQAIGIGTVIPNQTLIHPRLGWIDGTDVDYWLSPDISTETHELVALSLVRARARLAIKHLISGREKAAPNPMMVAVPEGATYNLGIQNIFHPFDGPAEVSTPDGDDPYGISKEGKVVQIYRSHDINTPE